VLNSMGTAQSLSESGEDVASGRDAPPGVVVTSETGVSVEWQGSELLQAGYVLYTLHCSFLDFQWEIDFRFSDVVRLHNAIATAASAVGLPPPAKTNRLHELRPEFLRQRRQEVLSYAQRVSASKQLWQFPAVKEFFQVGCISFDPRLGGKHREGLVWTSSGKLTQNVFTGFRKRWLVAKDSFVAYYDQSSSQPHQPRGLIVFDASFTVELSARDPREFTIRSQDRLLNIRAVGKDPLRSAAAWVACLRERCAANPRCQPMTDIPYRSFSPPRTMCSCTPLVCGREYMAAVAAALQSAQHEIFIADWRMNPGVLLTRHPDPALELKELLRAKAIQGVNIYVMLYREVSEKLQKKHRTAAIQAELQALHPNVRVIRHPDHISSRQLFWSHHDKIVVVDQQIAFVGGMDLTEGRFDDFLHRVGDLGRDACDVTSSHGEAECHDRYLGPEMWPKQEYYNPNAPKEFILSPSGEVVEAEASIPGEQGLDDGQGMATVLPEDMVQVMAADDDDFLEDHRRGSLFSSVQAFKNEDDGPGEGSDRAAGSGAGTWREGGGDAGKPGGGLDLPMPRNAGIGKGATITVATVEVVQEGEPEGGELIGSLNSDGHAAVATPPLSKDVVFDPAEPLGMRVDEQCSVIRVPADGQAASRGIALYDKIKAVNGVPVTTLAELEFQHYLCKQQEGGPSGPGQRQGESAVAASDRVSMVLTVEPLIPTRATTMSAVAGNTDLDPSSRVSSTATPSPAAEGLIDRGAVPRMPWHDVGVALRGPAARDIAFHFIARWNYHRLALWDLAQPTLLPHAAVYSSPLVEQVQLGMESDLAAESLGSVPLPQPTAENQCTVQVLRSAGPWSLGVNSTEQSIQSAWAQAIIEAKHFVYIEQQYFITSMSGPSEPTQGAASTTTLPRPPPPTAPAPASVPSSTTHMVEVPFRIRIPHGIRPGQLVNARLPDGRVVSIRLPVNCTPGGEVEVNVPTPTVYSPPIHPTSPSTTTQFASPPRAGTTPPAEPPQTTGRPSSIVGLLNQAMTATIELLGPTPGRFTSGVQNTIGQALLNRLRQAIQMNQRFRVLVVMPLHPNGRYLDSTECRAVMQQQFDTICRSEGSLLSQLRKEFPRTALEDYIVFTALRAHGEVTLGPVSEQVYVHSKVLIVDDEVAIIGSANLNDRSMVGDRDSEIAVRITDSQRLPSTMAGQSCMVGKFPHELRVRLWREHLGMVPLGDPQRLKFAQSFPRPMGGSVVEEMWDDDICDPVSNEVWHGTILGTARNNTDLYTQAFDTVPMQECSTIAKARESVCLSCVSKYVVAPIRSVKWQEQVQKVRLQASGIRGRLVKFPDQFLSDEKLEPSAAMQLVIDKKLFQ